MGLVLSLWPSGDWPESTREAGWLLCRDLEAESCHLALQRLAAEGREFPPPPGLLFKFAQAAEAELRPRLPEHAEPGPEERAQARLQAEQLRLWREAHRGPLQEVSDTWTAFREHIATGGPKEDGKPQPCLACAAVHRLICDLPEDRKKFEFTAVWVVACEAGRPLLENWYDAVEAAVDLAFKGDTARSRRKSA